MDSTARSHMLSVTVNMGKVGLARRQSTNGSTQRKEGWKVNGQVEQAQPTGTQHYQLMVLTPQTRFSAIKREHSQQDTLR